MIKLGNKKIKAIYFNTVSGFNVGKATVKNNALIINSRKLKDKKLVLSKEYMSKNIKKVYTGEKVFFNKDNN